MKDEKLPEALLAVASHIGALIEHSGFEPILGEIWVAMVMHEVPMTARQIAAALGRREAQVKKAIPEMERWGAVKRASGEAWSPELNPLKFTIKVLKEREEPAVRELEGLLERAAAEPALTQFSRGRVKLLQEIARLARVIFEILNTIFQLDAPVISKVRDTIKTFTHGVGGVLGALTGFGRR
jgi:DNA-binding transcriptional regulator GbsR (MarR family)